MRQNAARRAATLLFLSLTTFSAQLSAQSSTSTSDGARAIEKGNQGIELFEQGKWNEALERFRRAESIYHSPVFVLYSARALRNSGRMLEARDELRRLTNERLEPSAPELWKVAQRDGAAELHALEDSIPRVVVSVEGGSPGTRVTLDERAVTPGDRLEVDPGSHRVVATDGGRESREEFIATAGASEQRVVVKLSFPQDQGNAAPPARHNENEEVTVTKSGLYVPGLVVMGIGGTAIVGGGIVGALALAKKSDVRSSLPAGCEQTTCPASKRDEVEKEADKARTLGTVADVLFIAGATTVAVGVVLVLVAPSEASGKVTVRISPRCADLRVAF